MAWVQPADGDECEEDNGVLISGGTRALNDEIPHLVIHYSAPLFWIGLYCCICEKRSVPFRVLVMM